MRTWSAALFAFCAILVLVPCAEADDDFIVVAQVTYAAAGQAVDVPVYVRDLSGSPAGLDVDKPIRYLQFTVNFDHPEYISGCTSPNVPACQVTFRTAGVLADFEEESTPVTFSDGQSIFVRRVASNIPNWTLDAAAPGDLIGFLTFTIGAAVADGSELELTFDPDANATKLGDQTLTASETFGHGLRFAKGRVIVADCSIPPDPARLGFDWSGVLTGCTASAGGCRTGETVVFNASSTEAAFGTCETVSWQFGDGSAPRAGKAVVHEFAAGSYEVAMTVTTGGGSTTIRHTITLSDPCQLPPIETVRFRYDGPTSACSGFPGNCAIGESIHFAVIGDDAIAGCSTATWTFGDGTPTASGNAIDHTYAEEKVYQVVLHVVTAGGEGTRSQLVKVKPQVGCTATVPSSALINTPVLFHATSDVDGSAFLWTFFDFPTTTATTADVEKTYATLDTRSWRLLVSQDEMASCLKTGIIDIAAPRRRGTRH